MKIEMHSEVEARRGRERSSTVATPGWSSPLPWKNILVPTDLSEPSRYAVNTAAAVARKYGSKLILLHVVQCPCCGSFDAPPDAEEMMGQARKSLVEIAREMPAGVLVETKVRFGTRDPVQEILDEADHLSADLIVVATHGYTGLKRALLGSTAERVVRHAPCPVLVTRRPGEKFHQTYPRKEANPSKPDL